MDKDKRVVVRRSPAEWRAIMTRFECSGQSQRDFLSGRGAGAAAGVPWAISSGCSSSAVESVVAGNATPEFSRVPGAEPR